MKLIIGRDPTCDVVLSDTSVSGRHLEASLTENHRILIRDLGSSNGTTVNNQVIKTAEITKGDVIYLGNHRLNFMELFNRLALGSTSTTLSLIVGREAPADILLNYPVISARHIEITVIDKEFMIRDLHSSNGTFINGYRCTGNDFYRLPPRAKLELGNFEIPQNMIDTWLNKFLSSANNVVKTNIPVGKDRFIVGRSDECDIQINHVNVSKVHAVIFKQNQDWFIRDSKSANGTFVNGQKIIVEQIYPNSQILIGTQQLVLQFDKDGGLNDVQLDALGVRIEAKNIVYEWGSSGVRGIDDVQLCIYPGEMVALMGPSGAGKTTLMDLLAGNKTPTQGEVLFNGRAASKEFIANNIGYVPQQEDSFYNDLTVYETLYYACKLKLPSDTTHDEIEQRIAQLLKDMELEAVKDIIIGHSGTGISGGQAKRVNIALELISEPDVLFLDEPTSGLDSTSTDKLTQVLEELRNRGKTIIMTIHQPRVEVFNAMKQVILMGKGGKLVYYGPPTQVEAYFSAVTSMPKPKETNPSDFMLDVLDPDKNYKNWTSLDWKKHYLQSNHCQEYVEKRITRSAQHHSNLNVRKLHRSVWKQFQLLVHRYTLRKTRDVGSMRNLVVQPVIVGSILATIFNDSWQELIDLSDQRSSNGRIQEALEMANNDTLVQNLAMEQAINGLHPTLFLMAAAAFWFGCSNIAKELVSERKTYMREGKSGLMTTAYLGSIFSVQSLIVAIQTLLMFAFAWTFVGFGTEWSFLKGWFSLVLTGMVGLAVGVLISAASKTETQAITIVPIILLPQLMLSGYLKLFKDLSSEVMAISSLLPIKWSFEALSIQMYKGICTELGCYCNESEPEKSVFGETCDGEVYKDGVLTNLGDTLGFAKNVDEFNWTVISEFEALTLLGLICLICLMMTYHLLENTKSDS